MCQFLVEGFHTQISRKSEKSGTSHGSDIYTAGVGS